MKPFFGGMRVAGRPLVPAGGVPVEVLSRPPGGLGEVAEIHLPDAGHQIREKLLAERRHDHHLGGAGDHVGPAIQLPVLDDDAARVLPSRRRHGDAGRRWIAVFGAVAHQDCGGRKQAVGEVVCT